MFILYLLVCVSRSSLLDSAPVPLTEEELIQLATGSEMERGLLETLMAAPDQNTLKRNKERRKSVKDRRRSQQQQQQQYQELKRSRTRENNVLELLEEQEQQQHQQQYQYQYE